MLNVHQLNVFLIAAETLNFTQTAKRLHLTQSSVSQHIKSLETQLGIPLFLRKGRTLEITEAGKVLLPLAREIVEGSLRATEQMELLKREIHGHLIVGCNTAPGKYLLPLLLAEFHQYYPLVRITCQILPQDQTIEQLDEGVIQFALTNYFEDVGQTSDYQLYIQEPVYLVAPLNHPWAEQEVIDPEDLFDERFIMREPNSGIYRNTKHELATVGIDIEKLETLLVMGTSESVAMAVEQDLGAGFISQMIFDKIVKDRVAIIKVRGLDIVQDIYFGRQTVRPSTGAQAAFWEFINRLDPSRIWQELDGGVKQALAGMDKNFE